ncbi:hypothetical protein A2Z41_00655 [Microgenomates group bacterium RBG_19FT_COMBO_39_10]|nr:MAG: hypothetical protein A2Z41_00655 [Microgenomates group bacterium RBG_19FT_COMBO_39_10]
MQVSRKKIDPAVKKQTYNLLYKVIADIKNPDEAKEFLGSFLGESEQAIIARRLGIAYLLSKGKTYSFIKNNLTVSSTTVATIAKQINKGKGFKVALGKIQADEWAEKWAEKINQMFKRRK